MKGRQDAPDNANLLYRILAPGSGEGIFEIDPYSGVVRTCATVDREEVSEYHLVVEANDQGKDPGPRSATVMVHITVEDENDNSPQFSEKRYLVQIPEDSPINSQVLQVKATDRDRGNNAQVHYSILSHLPALINNSTGWITVSTQLDRETTENYHFGVEARDHGVPLRLNEDAAVGSSVLTLTAMDKDVNSVVTYQITSGNTRNRFAITSQSGGGLITLALPLDYKQERQYVLTVTASDGTLFDTVQVFINVTDANTHRPIFQSSHYTVSVSEDKPIGTSIVAISATDEDTGENARITYILEDNIPQFRIDPDTGTITTLMELDYEDQASYTLAITAHDNGIPQKSDTTYVEILILDANDNAPRFLRDRYLGSVFEDVPLSTSVLQVSAVDRDSGPNGRLTYTFLELITLKQTRSRRFGRIPAFCIYLLPLFPDIF
uniref:Cadherin domain-containing protein n=1 Tax=Laticauda laticaudata TaxID=8630 RepID=A0A8C5SCS1_LATLA